MIPVIHKDVVYHVGTEPMLKLPGKRTTSFEGPGLSVSEVPDAWRKIAQLGDLWLWHLERRDGEPGTFVDMLEVNREALLAEAASRGLVRAGIVYHVYRYDSEADEDTYFVFTDRRKAEEEALDVKECEEFPEWETRGVVEVDSYLPTAALNGRWRRFFTRPLDQAAVEDFAISTVLEVTKQYDGLWWEERLDPTILSAPRGVIFQSMLKHWRWEEVADAGEEDW